ncbi:PP2C family protein-serine/threonine phosphatase [candidate division KSB1 bacterium]|nr:PP2C family protein-serine/threonine phosphatase [candidate division KSB1 bacterium]NIR71764.1 PP2C family protein-serine/threonine phosphatase [candidate division KSB1 bacterium]NIS24920.1 PP2C family protein-serine/threonine phosphatase [candidate division KSB1 bacterium]NIT71796.1 PP2C family protein-serine/threonine phosphatase [candidate division KSB1 bacterium]NIU25534.1 PP2C family protein-serine/threonine phosphatase [candidate division KSB1 bacterium]
MFFKDQEVCCCQDAYGFSGSEWDELCLASGNKLIREIKKFRSESRFSIDYLPYEIKEDFVKNGFRHIIPIRFKDKLVGTFMIGEKRSETPFHLEDLTFLAAVARQASIAIENAFLHEELTEQERMKHELNIARRIQMASLPQRTPKIEGLEISGVSVPALEVGGDYFDYLNGVAPGVTVIVGDVSGKGTSAALYMSKVQGIIRSLHAFNLSPRELFIRVNQLLYQDLERKSFITAIGAFIDTKKQNLILARAGHLPLFYYSAKNKQVEMITPKGLGLGLDSADVFAAELEEQSIEYVSGDVFLFVTDGVTEAKTRGGGEFGEDKLTKVLESSFSCTADEIRDRVLSEVRGFVADSLPHDDQTVVVVKVR